MYYVVLGKKHQEKYFNDNWENLIYADTQRPNNAISTSVQRRMRWIDANQDVTRPLRVH